MWKSIVAGSSVACLVATAVATAARAQSVALTPADTSATQIEEVVVTAQRRSESLQTTPVAVTALTGSVLETRQLTQPENLSASVPGLLIQQISASASSVAIQMRGDAELSGGLVTSESPVALYVDDVYQSRLSVANFDLGDIARVEVLRGPQGTLYGRNSMTGAVKFITRQPDGSTWFDASVGYGTYDEKRFQVSGGAPVTAHLALALAGVFDQKDGWQRDETLGTRVGDRTNEGVRASVGLFDTDPVSAVLRVNYSHSYGDSQYLTPVNPATSVATVPFGDTLSPDRPKSYNTQTGGSLTVGYVIDPALTLHSTTSLSSLHDVWGLDFSGGFVAAAGDAPVAGFLRYSDSFEHQFTEELQASGDVFDGRLHYIGGLFYYDETAAQTINDTFSAGSFGGGFPAAPITLLPTSFTTTSASKAAYGQVDFKALSELTLTAGIRFTHDQKRFDGQIQSGVFDPTYAPVISTHLTANEWTPKISADYQLNDSVMTYATISRGYRAGGFNGLAIANPAVFGSPYAPETSWSYELGNKVDFWEKRARVNTALYYESLDNLQQTVVNSAGSTVTENAAKAHVYGLEIEGSVVPVKNVNLYTTISLANDGYDQLNPSTSAYQAHATRLPLVSHVQLQVGGSWRIEPQWMHEAAIIVAGDFDYRSSHYSSPDDAFVGYVPGTDLVNASIGVQSADKHWTLTAAGRNLTDQHFYYSGVSLVAGVISGKFSSPPTMGMLTLKYAY